MRDQGIGIEPRLLPHLFQPFTQAQHSIDRAQGGLGVGLALVRGLVERHGGRVSAKSDGPGRGSEFEVRLPIERGAVVARAGMAATSASDDNGEVFVPVSDGSVDHEVAADEDPEDGAASGRRVLVVDGERLVGLLSLDDVARTLGLRVAGPTVP